MTEGEQAPRLSGLLARRLSGPGLRVLLHELVRMSRRSQTYLFRTVFAGVLLGVVLMTWVSVSSRAAYDASHYAEVGRTLFVFYGLAQALLVAVVSPVLASQAIREEREAATQQLLTLSALSPGEVLWSKLGSRLLVLCTLVACAGPVLALVTSLGGVGAMEIVNVFSVTVLVGILTGLVGGMAAVRSGGVLASLASATAYVLAFSMALAPLMLWTMVVFNRGTVPVRDMAFIHPLFAAFSNRVEALAIWVVCLPTFVMFARLVTPSFRISTSDDADAEDFGVLSEDIWVLERHKRSFMGLGVLVLVWAVIFPVISRGLSFDVKVAGIALEAMGIYAVGSMLWVQLAAALHRQWRLATQPREKVERNYVGRLTRLQQALRRRVWPNPVLWREVMTRGQGPGYLLGRTGWIIWLLILPLFLFFDIDDDLLLFAVLVGWLVSAVGLGVSTAGSVVPERERGTLSGLLVANFSMHRVVLGKLAAVVISVLPLVTFAALMISRLTIYQSHSYWREDTCVIAATDAMGGYGGLALRLLITWGWSAMAVLAAAIWCLVVATLARPRAVAWAATLATALAWIPVPVFLLGVLFGPRLGHGALMASWFPMLGRLEGPECLPGPFEMISPGVQALVTVLGWVVLAWALRRAAHSDKPS